MKRVLLIVALATLAFGVGLDVAGQNKKKRPAPPAVAGKDEPKHDPANAVANLDVHPELQATLFASEPMITNPDQPRHRPSRPGLGLRRQELPRQQRQAARRRPHPHPRRHRRRRQGRQRQDLLPGPRHRLAPWASACWATRSSSPPRPTSSSSLRRERQDHQEGSPLHQDRPAAARPLRPRFVFGPDGRLYWNFGNTGHARPRQGRQAGRRSGRQRRSTTTASPTRQGMVFRCDLGRHRTSKCSATTSATTTKSAVDSFGTIWQSDNDDDGNRGVRINYVMEFGNFGYVDEMTGAGWQTQAHQHGEGNPASATGT